MHGLFKKARREQGLTQSELAQLVGCRQSAISMFESGRVDALSRDTLEALANVLHVEILPEPPAETTGQVLKYCPIAECPSNIPYVVGDQLCFNPSLVRESSADRGHCPSCGEFLESGCPNPDCNAPIRDGAFCWSCGEAHVAPAVSLNQSAEAWARDRRKQIRDIRQLSTITTREHATPASMLNLRDRTNVQKRKTR